jgi:Flp pilus assembly protein TadB
MVAALAIGGLVGLAVAPPPILTALLLVGAPILAFLLIESSLSARSQRHKHRVLLELPVVSEQLGMLLSAGYSLGAAITRIAQRSDGAIAHDLRRVVTRIGHGVDEIIALTEWSDVADVPALTRLIGVLALDRDAGDLGRLITEEARATRGELHRGLVETIEKRTQQVWIPVTVATLVPGLLFLAVPFTEALALFSAG